MWLVEVGGEGVSVQSRRGFQKVDKGMKSGGKVCEQCRGEPGRGDTRGGEQEGRAMSGVCERRCVQGVWQC